MQQVNDDTKGMSEYLRDKEPMWGTMLGKLVYKTCYEKLPGPARMLALFKHLADISNARGEYLSWTVPITNAPVVQAYRMPVAKRTKLTYGEEELKVQIEAWDEARLNESASSTGAAPNIVHSFDAAHLAMVLDSADFPMSVIHDSFGCHAGNMDKLFVLARKEFVEFYEVDPLALLLEELMVPELMPERGNLDISKIMESDYAFL
jgi:DNA-directed RNA polymerase